MKNPVLRLRSIHWSTLLLLSFIIFTSSSLNERPPFAEPKFNIYYSLFMYISMQYVIVLSHNAFDGNFSLTSHFVKYYRNFLEFCRSWSLSVRIPLRKEDNRIIQKILSEFWSKFWLKKTQLIHNSLKIKMHYEFH